MSIGRILLVDASPKGERGSMPRYADLVRTALAPANVDRVRIALPLGVSSVFGARIGTWIQHAWRMSVARFALAGREADVYHILDGSCAYVGQWISPRRCVITCHDMIPQLQAEGSIPGREPSPAALWVMKKSVCVLSRAGHVITDSENTRQDAIRLAGVKQDRATVVPLALTREWCSVGEIVRDPAESPLILHIGNSASYKNRQGVLRIFRRIQEKVPAKLLMVGPDDKGLRQSARTLGIGQVVEWRENVTDSELKGLYGSAALLLFPSLYEGFGWPVLEAMACGCPVVCSHAASLPEVAGGAALMADPSDEAGLAAHCIEMLTRKETWERYCRSGLERASGFSIERMVEGLRKAYAACGS